VREKNLNREFYDLLKRLVDNFNTMLLKFGSVRKASLIFRNMLKRIQKEDLHKVFFNSEGNLIEPFNEETIEKGLSVTDYFVHDGEKFMYHRLDVSQMESIIKLNEMIEARNLQECVTDIFSTFKNLEVEQKKVHDLEIDFQSDLMKRKLLRQYKPAGPLNLQRMKQMKNSIIENLEEFERKFGVCKFITTQNRTVSESLEKVIRTFNKHEMKQAKNSNNSPTNRNTMKKY
jgi:hypothetical protein